MIDSDMIRILCCPKTHQVVNWADPVRLEELNGRVGKGELMDCEGRCVTEKLEGGLVRSDQKLLFPVQEGVPVMLTDRAIPLRPLDEAGSWSLTHGQYRARQAWQTSENAEAYRKNRDPSCFHRYYIEEEIMASWLVDLPQGATVLDNPCGTGRFLPTLTGRGFRYIGGDISLSMIKEARLSENSQLVLGFVNADAEALPFRDNSVDCVVIWRFLHHVGDAAVRKTTIREAARVTRQKVLLSFYHPISFTFVRRFIRGKLFPARRQGGAVTHWQLKREAEDCGLRLDETRGFRKYISVNWFACLRKLESPGAA